MRYRRNGEIKYGKPLKLDDFMRLLFLDVDSDRPSGICIEIVTYNSQERPKQLLQILKISYFPNLAASLRRSIDHIIELIENLKGLGKWEIQNIEWQRVENNVSGEETDPNYDLQSSLQIEHNVPNVGAYTSRTCDESIKSVEHLGIMGELTFFLIPPKRINIRKIRIGSNEHVMCFDLRNVIGELSAKTSVSLNGVVLHENIDNYKNRIFFDDFLSLAKQYYEYHELLDRDPDNVMLKYLTYDANKDSAFDTGEPFFVTDKILDCMLRDAVTTYDIPNKERYKGSHILKSIVNFVTSDVLDKHQELKDLEDHMIQVVHKSETFDREIDKTTKETVNIISYYKNKGLWEDYTDEQIDEEVRQFREMYIRFGTYPGQTVDMHPFVTVHDMEFVQEINMDPQSYYTLHLRNENRTVAVQIHPPVIED